MLWNTSGGNSQIAWRQIDEQEWEIRIEAIADIMKVKNAFKEIDSELEKYGVVQTDKKEMDGYRFIKTVKYAHESVLNADQQQDFMMPRPISFGKLLHHIIDACLMLQDDIHAQSGDENDKTRFIQKILLAKYYDVLDQTQRGVSATGKKSGEVDLLIIDYQKRPFFLIIEALNLSSVDTAEINLHINKVTKYDLNGLLNNIILVYSTRKDFKGMLDGYTKHISDTEFDYPLSDVRNISDSQFSEIKLLSSTFERSGMKRNLFHILINLNK